MWPCDEFVGHSEDVSSNCQVSLGKCTCLLSSRLSFKPCLSVDPLNTIGLCM